MLLHYRQSVHEQQVLLPPNQPLRKAKKSFRSGKAENRPPPEKLTQEEVMINSLTYENAKNPTQAAGFATATGSKGCYCLMLITDHDRTTQVCRYNAFDEECN